MYVHLCKSLKYTYFLKCTREMKCEERQSQDDNLCKFQRWIIWEGYKVWSYPHPFFFFNVCCPAVVPGLSCTSSRCRKSLSRWQLEFVGGGGGWGESRQVEIAELWEPWQSAEDEGGAKVEKKIEPQARGPARKKECGESQGRSGIERKVS